MDKVLLLTTEKLYRWGENSVGYTAVPPEDITTRTIQEIALPSTLTAVDIARVEASFGTLSLLTKTGDVYIKSFQSPYMYGDGTTVLDNNWHQATLSNVKYLKHNLETILPTPKMETITPGEQPGFI